jgi:hypothetical protein
MGLPPEQAEIYRSETKRAAAEVTFADGTTVEGHLHLQQSSAPPAGFETPLELLNRDEFFYALSREAGDVALLSKAQTAVVSCAHEAPLPDEERLSVVTAAKLEVRLASGPRYRGWAMWELPPSHSRPLDYLNAAGEFLEIADETGTYYINRVHVRAVYPLD